MALADAKAASIQESDALVIGADQILVCGTTWFDKPAYRRSFAPDAPGNSVFALHLRVAE